MCSRNDVLRLLAVAAIAAGCAKREPPSGGPPDLTPPRVIASVPDSGAARVPLEAVLEITFSEGMEPRSTGDAVSLAPHAEIEKRRWRGRTLALVPAQPLRPNQTYTLFVGRSARDRHGNSPARGATVVFSTGDSFPPGRIDGKIEARGFSVTGTFLWGYDASRGREPDSTAKDFDALGIADEDGRFRVDGLVVPGRYRLWAFADLNGNRSFEPLSDILAPVDTTFALTPEAPVASEFKAVVINPRAPGRVRGAVLDSLPDSLGTVRVLAVSEKDSTRRTVGDVGPEGQFDLQLGAEIWLLRAFRDLDDDKDWQPELEPASAGLRVEVQPASDLVEIRLVIRRENR